MMIEDWQKGIALQDRCREEVNGCIAALLKKWTYTKAKQLREAIATYEAVKNALRP